MIKGIRINKSKIVHLYCASTDRTDCGAGGMDSVSFNGGVETAEAVTCKRCLKSVLRVIEQLHGEALQLNQARDEVIAIEKAHAGNMDRIRGGDYAEAVEMDELRTMARAYLSTPSGVVLTSAEIEQALADRQAENDAFFDDLAREHAHADAIKENQRREFASAAEELKAQDRAASAKLVQLVSVSAPTSRRQRRANRRALRATARRQTPQTRAAARARRARRGEARATAKTLLVAAGVPQDIANRYASSFSRGTQARTASERIRMGKRNSKRVEVKRYTWAEFAGRLSGYHPGSHPRGDVAVAFNVARDRVLAMA